MHSTNNRQPMRPRYLSGPEGGKWYFPYGKRTDPTRTRAARAASKQRRTWRKEA